MQVLGRGFVIHFPHPKSASKHHWLHSSAHQRVDALFGRFERETAARYANLSVATTLCPQEGKGKPRASVQRVAAAGVPSGGAREPGGNGAKAPRTRDS